MTIFIQPRYKGMLYSDKPLSGGVVMYFENLLDIIFGPREILHAMECSVCGDDEIYYIDYVTKKQIGRACKGCNFVQTFEGTIFSKEA